MLKSMCYFVVRIYCLCVSACQQFYAHFGHVAVASLSYRNEARALQSRDFIERFFNVPGSCQNVLACGRCVVSQQRNEDFDDVLFAVCACAVSKEKTLLARVAGKFAAHCALVVINQVSLSIENSVERS